MNLFILFNLMKNKKYNYFSGNSNLDSDDVYVEFSTGLHGRGDVLEFRLGDNNNDVYFYYQHSKKNISKLSITNEELIKVLNDNL